MALKKKQSMSNVAYIVKEILDRMGFREVLVNEETLGERVRIDLKLACGRDLIGEGGEILASFQHIARRIVSRRVTLAPVIDIDVNGYKKMRESVLRDFALDVRERAMLGGKTIELEPMPPFDRRVIHITLAQFSDVSTESAGEGRSRYVTIRPQP